MIRVLNEADAIALIAILSRANVHVYRIRAGNCDTNTHDADGSIYPDDPYVHWTGTKWRSVDRAGGDVLGATQWTFELHA